MKRIQHDTVGSIYPVLSTAKQLGNEAEFRIWLANAGIGGRTLGDIVSRTKRAAAFFDILARGSDAEVIFKFTQLSDFMLLSANVKSQLKRAVGLYRDFAKERR